MSKSEISREYAEKHDIPVVKLDANDVLFHGFDMDELRNVAIVIKAINPHTSHLSVNDVMDHIRDVAIRNLREDYPCYVATMGFNVSGYYRYGVKTKWFYRVTVVADGLVKHLNV